MYDSRMLSPARIPPLRPSLARATRGRLVRHDGQRRTLTSEAEEAIFQCGELLSEGCQALRPGSDGGARYFGTSMFSVDLEAVSRRLGARPSLLAFAELRDAVEGSMRVRLRLMRWARAEAARRVPSHMLGMATVETRVRLDENQLHIDVDLEVPLEVLSERSIP